MGRTTRSKNPGSKRQTESKIAVKRKSTESPVDQQQSPLKTKKVNITSGRQNNTAKGVETTPENNAMVNKLNLVKNTKRSVRSNQKRNYPQNSNANHCGSVKQSMENILMGQASTEIVKPKPGHSSETTQQSLTNESEDEVDYLDESQESVIEGNGIRYSIDANNDPFFEEVDGINEGDLVQPESDKETMSDFEGDFVQPTNKVQQAESIAESSEVQFNYRTPQKIVGPTNEEEVARFMMENPYLNDIFKKMIQQGIQAEVQKQNVQGQQVTNSGKQGKAANKTNERINVIKAPSDTTLYAPALRKMTQSEEANKNLINKISNFVEEVRIESRRGSPGCAHKLQVNNTEMDMEENVSTARHVIDAEQFKANVEAPQKGMLVINNQVSNDIEKNANSELSFNKQMFDQIQYRNSDREFNDDEFFYLTCNVDSATKARIEKGEYIELEKLLPKPRSGREDSHLEWVSKEGMAFLNPVQDHEQRITNVRHWEQAFRVYAAIYCVANPSRAGEIWQYIYTINAAASTYIWENVAYYDMTFRQMMAERPARPWSKTYTQLWQLSLKDTIPKNNNNYASNAGNNQSGKSGGESSGGPGNSKNHKTWHDNCCWIFNRNGKCNRSGCRFDNHCSYCGAWNHESNSCKKRLNNEKAGKA